MLDKAIKGSKLYWAWVGCLLAVIGVGTLTYIFVQLREGLGVTGMSRDVSWGFYIAQFTFLVGVAASGLMVVLPYYLHHYKAFAKVTILGEFLAIGAVLMCMTFIFVDLGMPSRVLNVPLHPTFNSMMFYDMVVLFAYLGLNVIIGLTVLAAEKKEKEPPYAWLRPVIYLSIAWAPLIHTVTAFLYAGLPGRHLWLTAVMAARFLASAFAAGPSLLLIFYFVMGKTSGFEVNREATGKIAQIVVYAMIINMFLLGLEFFTAYYSQIPGHMDPLRYLYFGLEGHDRLVPFMWFSMVLGIASILLLLFPQARANSTALIVGLLGVFISSWIDKGLGLIVGGFIPSPLGHITEYAPTLPELLITLGVYGIGALVITVLYKMVVEIREETA
jgi:Ni/Fe-hydrogenase subunit HybB-like protein